LLLAAASGRLGTDDPTEADCNGDFTVGWPHLKYHMKGTAAGLILAAAAVSFALSSCESGST
jgi:hypothetical protein